MKRQSGSSISPRFLHLHERAFRDLGGVVRVIRHDNITAGVSRAILDRFLQHVDILIMEGRSYRLEMRRLGQALTGSTASAAATTAP